MCIKKINWKGHVVMPEMVDGSYHLTNFYAVWNAHSIYHPTGALCLKL